MAHFKSHPVVCLQERLSLQFYPSTSEKWGGIEKEPCQKTKSSVTTVFEELLKGNDVSARPYHKGNHCTLTHILIKNCESQLCCQLSHSHWKKNTQFPHCVTVHPNTFFFFFSCFVFIYSYKSQKFKNESLTKDKGENGSELWWRDDCLRIKKGNT